MLNNMRITKAFFLIMCLSICTKAQVSPLQKSLVKIIKIDENLFKSNSNFNNKNFIVFIGISVNKFGLVDTVIYNKRDLTHEKDQLRQLINFESIATVIKQNKKDFKPYKNEFLVLMIYLRRGDDDVVTNPDDLE